MNAASVLRVLRRLVSIELVDERRWTSSADEDESAFGSRHRDVENSPRIITRESPTIVTIGAVGRSTA